MSDKVTKPDHVRLSIALQKKKKKKVMGAGSINSQSLLVEIGVEGTVSNEHQEHQQMHESMSYHPAADIMVS